MFVAHDVPLLLKCDKGLIGEFFYTGAIPNTSLSHHDFCWDAQSKHEDYIQQCSDGYVDQNQVKNAFVQNCQNKPNCTFNLVELLTHPVVNSVCNNMDTKLYI